MSWKLWGIPWLCHLSPKKCCDRHFMGFTWKIIVEKTELSWKHRWCENTVWSLHSVALMTVCAPDHPNLPRDLNCVFSLGPKQNCIWSVWVSCMSFVWYVYDSFCICDVVDLYVNCLLPVWSMWSMFCIWSAHMIFVVYVIFDWPLCVLSVICVWPVCDLCLICTLYVGCACDLCILFVC